jgi:NAD dependent epimerase/dehydratase family
MKLLVRRLESNLAHFRHSEVLVHHHYKIQRSCLPRLRVKHPAPAELSSQHSLILCRPYLLLAGFGDIARRITKQTKSSVRIIALSRKRPTSSTVLWKQNDFDQRLRPRPYPSNGYMGLIYLAPPPNHGLQDRRLHHVLWGLNPKRAVYISTTGVYGHHPHQWIDETCLATPVTDRARRRQEAEKVFRRWARSSRVKASILRVPGIYAHDRLPLERLKNQTPALMSEEDVYTNHIHADDLARLIWHTLFKGKAQRLYNACDDTHLKMGDYFDCIANAFGLSLPPRLNRITLSHSLSPLQYSFMQESRQIKSLRIKKELGFYFSYPCLENWIQEAASRYLSNPDIVHEK